MNNLMIFQNKKVEVFELKGKVLFNPYNVGDCLDLTESAVRMAIGKMNNKQAIKLTNSDVKDIDFRKLNNAGENFLTESGVYKLIFKSTKEQAEKFQDWVTDEVLPSIRRHGMFATEELLDDPDLLIKVATQLKEEKLRRLEAEKKVQIMEPKAEFYDDVAGSKDAIEMSDVAKVLAIKGIGRNKLFELLREKKILQPNNIPYQQYVGREYFRVLEQKYTTSKGETKINIKTLVFQKGVDYIRKLVKEVITC